MNVRSLISICIILVTAMAAAEPLPVVGTRLHLTPPAGFVPSPDFPGFVNAKARASISVAEVPASFIELRDGYSNSGLAAKGMQIIGRETFEKDGLRAELVRGEIGREGRRLVKLILLTGDVSESVVVTATYIKRYGAYVDEALYACLRDAVWDSTRYLDHFEGLGFELKEVPDLRVATRVSNSVIFTRDGRLPDQYYTGQMLIVGWATGDASNVTDRRAFAERRFGGIELLTELEIDNTEAVTIAELPGFETVGSGRHGNLGYDTAAFQVALFDGDRIFMAQGFANVKNKEKSYSQFRTVVGTLATE